MKLSKHSSKIMTPALIDHITNNVNITDLNKVALGEINPPKCREVMSCLLHGGTIFTTGKIVLHGQEISTQGHVILEGRDRPSYQAAGIARALDSWYERIHALDFFSNDQLDVFLNARPCSSEVGLCQIGNNSKHLFSIARIAWVLKYMRNPSKVRIEYFWSNPTKKSSGGNNVLRIFNDMGPVATLLPVILK